MTKHETNQSIDAIGIMSGTSLDGLDIAACRFEIIDGEWTYHIAYCTTIAYNQEWRKRLESIFYQDAESLAASHVELGKLIAHHINGFIHSTGFRPRLIASHGHTVFHNPAKGITFQIGSGAEIAAATGFPVVCDFRTSDVALGGQGAPLVPVGDKLLFNQYQACLNLGGFSNISFDLHEKRIAFDICPVNIVLNELAQQTGRPYDKDGLLAKDGHIIPPLLDSLNRLVFYQQSPPKTLGREWLNAQVMPLLQMADFSPQDKLRTFVEHIATQINQIIHRYKIQNILTTGGGTHNTFLMKRIRQICSAHFIVPDNEVIDFKEALIFAFIGTLRWLTIPNCLASVTGASSNSLAGAVYLPPLSDKV